MKVNAEYLKALIKSKGMTESEFAVKIGVTDTQLQEYMSAEDFPLDPYLKLIEVIGVKAILSSGGQ